jgi:hypothetical protein
VEQDDLVEPVEEFGPEMAADHLHHLRLDILDLLAVGEAGQELAAEVRGQDDDRVGESTVRPWPSVSRPSSSTWRRTLKTSPWAFSTSSNRTTW